jgi:hypothetical protein
MFDMKLEEAVEALSSARILVQDLSFGASPESPS